MAGSRLSRAVRLREYVESEQTRSGEKALEIIVDTFNTVLDELRGKSTSGAFDNYHVSIIAEPAKIRASLGDLNGVRYFVFVASPNPDFNLFDVLDQGRPALPARDPKHPYPLWGLRQTPLVRRTRQGESFVNNNSIVFGAPRGTGGGPGVYSAGPIKKVEPLNLYSRIFNLSKKNLKKQGIENWAVVWVRKGRD